MVLLDARVEVNIVGRADVIDCVSIVECSHDAADAAASPFPPRSFFSRPLRSKAAHALGRIAADMKRNAKSRCTPFTTRTSARPHLAAAKCERDKRVACACALLRTCLTHVFTNYKADMKR